MRLRPFCNRFSINSHDDDDGDDDDVYVATALPD